MPEDHNFNKAFPRIRGFSENVQKKFTKPTNLAGYYPVDKP